MRIIFADHLLPGDASAIADAAVVLDDSDRVVAVGRADGGAVSGCVVVGRPLDQFEVALARIWRERRQRRRQDRKSRQDFLCLQILSQVYRYFH